jgi:hypothetical protein
MVNANDKNHNNSNDAFDSDKQRRRHQRYRIQKCQEHPNRGDKIMTCPAKENLIYFEQLAQKQLPIYDDACDYGIKIGNLLALMKVYKYELTRPTHARYPHDSDWKNCSKTTLFIPFEKEHGMFIGCRLTVYFESYTNFHRLDKNGTVEILTIEIGREAQKDNPFQPIKEKSNADKWAENARDARRFN